MIFHSRIHGLLWGCVAMCGVCVCVMMMMKVGSRLVERGFIYVGTGV